MKWFEDQYTTPKNDRNQITVSPLRATTEQLHGLTDVLVITDEADVLRNEGEAYAQKLLEAGVNTTAGRLNRKPKRPGRYALTPCKSPSSLASRSKRNGAKIPLLRHSRGNKPMPNKALASAFGYGNPNLASAFRLCQIRALMPKDFRTAGQLILQSR